MTPEIKARIAQIRRGEVPEGYKKTKTDIVPEYWKENKISMFINEHIEKTTVENQYPVLTSARMGLMLQTDYYTNHQVTTSNNIGYNVLPLGYITFRSRSDDGRFKFNENRIIGKGIISYFYPVFNFDSKVNQTFMLYLLNETIYRRMYPYVEGTAQQVLSLKKLGSLRYALPPLAEQQKIASILTTQDKVIELKEKLLGEKQRQKKYLMQQLLTGKKRLPGFDKPWKKEKLSNFCEFLGGGTPDTKKEEYWNGNISWVSSSDLVEEDIHYIHCTRFITEEAIAHSATRLCPAATILLVSRVGVGKVAVTTNELCTSQDFTNIVQTKHDTIYLAYSLYFLMQEKCKQVQGSAIKGIPTKEIKQYQLSFPSKDEQTAIAEILSAADREINLLQKEIEQEKQKKKALMQMLLTGIVRVTA